MPATTAERILTPHTIALAGLVCGVSQFRTMKDMVEQNWIVQESPMQEVEQILASCPASDLDRRLGAWTDSHGAGGFYRRQRAADPTIPLRSLAYQVVGYLAFKAEQAEPVEADEQSDEVESVATVEEVDSAQVADIVARVRRLEEEVADYESRYTTLVLAVLDTFGFDKVRVPILRNVAKSLGYPATGNKGDLILSIFRVPLERLSVDNPNQRMRT